MQLSILNDEVRRLVVRSRQTAILMYCGETDRNSLASGLIIETLRWLAYLHQEVNSVENRPFPFFQLVIRAGPVRTVFRSENYAIIFVESLTVLVDTTGGVRQVQTLMNRSPMPLLVLKLLYIIEDCLDLFQRPEFFSHYYEWKKGFGFGWIAISHRPNNVFSERLKSP